MLVPTMNVDGASLVLMWTTNIMSRWFRARVGTERGRVRRIAIVALARKLLIALWRYVTHGEVPEGAVLKPT